MKVMHRDVVSALIFSKDNKMLMGTKDPADGGVYADCWHIPGGGMDDGESQLQALQREILEETGIDISKEHVKLVDDLGTGEAERTLKDTGERVLCKMKFNIYEVKLKAVAADIVLDANDDLKNLTWVALPNIKNLKLTPPSVPLFTRLGYVKAST